MTTTAQVLAGTDLEASLTAYLDDDNDIVLVNSSNPLPMTSVVSSTQIYADNTSLVAKTQANGTQTLTLTAAQQKARTHQISLDYSTGAVGTVAVQFKPIGSTKFETLYDEFGVAVSLNLAAMRSIITEVAAEAFNFTPTGMGGSDTYTVCIVGWV